MAKYRLRENQHGNILLQRRNPHTRQWETEARYPNYDAYKEGEYASRGITFRGPREKAQITE